MAGSKLLRGLAALSPAVAALAFPAPSLWPVALVCLVPSVVLISRTASAKGAALLGWLGGAAYFSTTHYWMAHKTLFFQPFIAALFGVTWIPWALSARATLGRGRVLGGLAAVPSLWTLGELARSWDRLGGPWALFGSTQWNSPWGLELASWGGVWLVGWIVVAINVAVAAWVLNRWTTGPDDGSAHRLAPPLGVAASCVCLAVVVGLAWVQHSTRRPPTGAPVLRVAGVQPGVIDPADERFAVGEALTRRLGEGYELVVWGESSLGEDPFSSPEYMDRLEALAETTGAPLLANVDARTQRGSIYKTSLLVDADGPKSRYDKRRLVPFGEYVPLRSVMGWVTRFTDAADEDRGRGTTDVVMEVPRSGVRIAPIICFESAFPDMSRALTGKGADVIVVQSANTTFQESWLPAQHASLSALRAAETGRPVIHATISGMSSAFDADGRQLVAVATAHRGTWSAHVPLFQRKTLYARAGNWAVWASVLLVLSVGAFSAAAVSRPSATQRPKGFPMSPDSRQASEGSSPFSRCGVGRGLRAAFHAALPVSGALLARLASNEADTSDCMTATTAAVITDVSSGVGSGVITNV